MSKSNWIKGGCVAAALFMAVVLFVGARKIGVVNTLPSLGHKVEHFFYYGGMAALLAYGFGRRYLWVPIVFVALIGLLDEWHQLYVPRRNGSPVDWAVDVVAAAVTVYLFSWWIRRREKVKVKVDR